MRKLTKTETRKLAEAGVFENHTPTQEKFWRNVFHAAFLLAAALFFLKFF